MRINQLREFFLQKRTEEQTEGLIDVKPTEDMINKAIRDGQFIKVLDLVKLHKLKGYTCTQSTLKKKLSLDQDDIDKLNYVSVVNPRYRNAGHIKLYLKAQALIAFDLKNSLFSKSESEPDKALRKIRNSKTNDGQVEKDDLPF